MLRFARRGVVVGALLGGGALLLLGGSRSAPAEPAGPGAPGQKVVLKEEGRSARTCVIEKSTPLPTGSIVHHVRDVDSGATFTVLDQRNSAKPSSLIGRLFNRADPPPAVTMTPAEPPAAYVKAPEPPARPAPEAEFVRPDPLMTPPGRLPGEPAIVPPPPPRPTSPPPPPPVLGTPAGRWKDISTPDVPPARPVANWSEPAPLSVPGEPSRGMMSVLARAREARPDDPPAPAPAVAQVSHTQAAAPPAPVKPVTSASAPLVGDAWGQAFLLLVLREALGVTEREQAARLLAGGPRRDAPETTAALFRTAHEDPSPTVRACCVRCLGALGQLQQPANHAAVQRLAKDPDPRVTEELHRAVSPH
jgi:hypothetical protein